MEVGTFDISFFIRYIDFGNLTNYKGKCRSPDLDTNAIPKNMKLAEDMMKKRKR